MKSKDTRIILLIILIVIIAWLILKFLGEVPFWAWALIAAILVYLNWGKIRKKLGNL